jgi:hypothetical protein
MNVLQRRMFQAGGPSDKLIQIEPVNSELIRYYVQQGYSPLEIQEVYPAANLGIIEQIAREEGGSLNPAVSLGESFTGSPVVTPAQRADIIAESISTPLGNLSFEASAEPELPRVEDISVVPKSVRDYITNAGGVLDRANLVRGLGVSFGMSEAEANSAIDLVTGSTVPERAAVDAPDLPGLADVMTGEQAEAASSVLGPNQYRDSRGNINKIDSEKFKTFIGGLSPTEIQAMFQAPDVEYGQELKNILSARAAQVKTPASLFDPRPEMIGKPQLNAPITPGTAAKEYAGMLKDLGIETAEELYNLGRRGIGAFDYFFKSQEEYDKKGPFERIDFKTGRFKELDDPTDPYPTSRAGDIERGFNILGAPENRSRFYGSSVDRGGQARFGMSADELDSLILQSSIGPAQPEVTDEITKEIEALEKQAAPVTTTEIVAGETAATEEEIQDAEAQAKAEEKVLEDAETAPKTEEQKKADATPPVVSAASTPEQVGSIFNSPDFISYVANVSKGMAKTGEVGSGLALGSALAAEERSLKDLEKEKLDRELLLKRLESGKLSFSEAKGVYDLNNTANLAAQSFQNSTSTISLIKELENVLKNKNPTSLSNFAKDIFERARVALGNDTTGSIEDFKKLSSTQQAKKLSTLISQANIREILGESGRTISNFDRQIVQDLSTSIVPGAPAASNLLALNNVEKRIRNNMQTQMDEIRSARRALNLFGMDLVGSNAFDVIKNGILLADETGVDLGQDIIDFRDEFKK